MKPEQPNAPCLLVDMGNQRLKWRLSQTSTPSAGIVPIPESFRDGLSDSTAQGEFRRSLDGVFGGMDPPNRVLLSAVSQGDVTAEFLSWCLASWQVVAESVETPKCHGQLVNGYDIPEQLGCDRWLAALAAYWMICIQEGEDSVIVVDAGTAVTVDLVRGHRFVGGTILPGIATIVRVLGRDTGKIQLESTGYFGQATCADVVDEIPVAATNSNAAVHAGAFYAVCGGVERCLDRLMAMAGGVVRVLVCGGDAILVSQGIRHRSELRQNLVLDGLGLVAAGEAS